VVQGKLPKPTEASVLALVTYLEPLKY
jgi:hypothetical protein